MTDFIVRAGGPLTGRLSIPGDKSISHRAVLLGSIAHGETEIRDLLPGEDIYATMNAFRACGVEMHWYTDRVVILGEGIFGLEKPDHPIDCGNSGTSIRLLTGLFSGQPFPVTFVGDESLSARPMRRVVQPLELMGASIALSDQGTPPVHISLANKLTSIQWRLSVASAQVKSAILLAGLYAEGTTRITEPRITRDHTETLLNLFGCSVERNDEFISVRGGAKLVGQKVVVPGDFSSAAFLIVAALLIPDSDIELEGIGVNITRTGLLEVLELMGASIEIANSGNLEGEPIADLQIRASGQLKGVDVPQQLIPRLIDEVPILAIAAAKATGTTTLSGCSELRVKESDRIHTVALGLRQLGISVEERPDGMVIEGGQLTGGVVDSFGDHRIAMAFAVAGALSSEQVRVTNCECVATSFPGFAETLQSAGIDIESESNRA